MLLVGEAITTDIGWLRIDQIAGEAGTTRITLTCIEENYGRTARTKTITGTTSRGVTGQCVVTNLGADEFVSMDTNAHKIGDGESALSINGESNASLLNVTLGNNATGVALSSIEVSTDGGTTWTAITNNSNIANDPGLTGKYKFRINLSVSQFALTSGTHLALTARGSEHGIGETLFRTSITTVYNSTDTYDLSSMEPLTIIGNSDSGSLTLSGTLSTLPCLMYLSFDNGSTWSLYTVGDAISDAVIENGGMYMFKVEVDTSSLTSESADMSLNVIDNTGTARATTTISFTDSE